MNVRTYEVNPFAIDEVRIIPVGAYGAGGGLSDEAKDAILDAFEHVAWIDDQGQTYIDAIREAFYPPIPATSIALNKSALSFTTIGATQTLVATVMPSDSTDTVTWSSSDTSVATVNNGVVTTVAYGTATITATAGSVSATCSVVVAQATLTSISAVYTQSGTVYPETALDDLKADLVVTATYSDSTTETIEAADYTLSGTLTEGTSTITVTYSGKTTSFNVTVSPQKLLFKLSDGDFAIQAGAVSWDTTHDIYTNTGYNPLNGRKNIYCSDGVKPYKTTDNDSTYTDTNPPQYPIPIPSNATGVTYTVTPNTQFMGVALYTYDASTNKYTRTDDVGWKQGSHTVTFAAGSKHYLTSAFKYNSAGSSYPTAPTEVTIQFLTD